MLTKAEPNIYTMGETKTEQIPTKEELMADTYVLDVYKNKELALSNSLLQSREKSSLLESKIEFLAIYRLVNEMQTRELTDIDGNKYTVHHVDIDVSEIRRLVERKKSGSLYDAIAEVAVQMKQKLSIYKNPDKNEFRMDNLYGEVAYEGGRLSIDFNPRTEFLFLDLKKNFGKINLSIAFSFKTNGGFQLFKEMKSYAYELPPVDLTKSQEEQATYCKEFSISEFRLKMGYVDLNQEEIIKEGMKKNPDSDAIVAKEKNPKFKRWSDFNARVIEPGVKEVNAISDIYISEIKTLNGNHGKKERLLIKMQHNVAFYKKNNITEEKDYKEEKKQLTSEEIDDFIDEMRSFMGTEIPATKNLKAIAEEAQYDMEVIKEKYEMLKGKTLENPTGWLISAIRDNYKVESYQAPKKNSFSDYARTDIDFDAIERATVKNR